MSGTGLIEVYGDVTGQGTSRPGDDFAHAYPLTSIGEVELGGATREDDEPDNTTGDPDSGTRWLTYTTTGPGTLTFDATSTAGFAVELWEGDTVDDLHMLRSDSGSPLNITEPVAANTRYSYRIYPLVSTDTGTVDYEWDFVARAPEFRLTAPVTEIEQTPVGMRASVTNGTPDAPVRFTIDEAPTAVLLTDELDSTGVLVDALLPLPELEAGTYTLRVTEGEGDPVAWTGQSGTITFEVDEDPRPYPTLAPADEPPLTVPDAPVQRWVVQDVTAGTSYTFPANPAEMTPPHAPRELTVRTTTLAGYTDDTGYTQTGRPLTWEGAAKPHQWEWRGFTSNEAFLTKLTDFAASNRRWYLVDHRKRAWVVSFEHLDARPQIKPNLPWAHEYTMRCLIYAGPQQL
jgi:hypothetical protein